jgi:hypothetical protein
MSQFSQLREQIDACRPGSDDLSLPAMAELTAVARMRRCQRTYPRTAIRPRRARCTTFRSLMDCWNAC